MKDRMKDFLLAAIQPNLRLMHNLDALEELCRFIQAHGQVEPLRLWFDNGSFRIVDGEKQWRACCKLGMTTVQAVIVEMTFKQTIPPRAEGGKGPRGQSHTAI